MSSPKQQAQARAKRPSRRGSYPPDAKERKVLVTLELLTKEPQNYLRAYYRAPVPFATVHQVRVQAVRPER